MMSCLNRRDQMLAKVRGGEVNGIPFATYNFHPFGPHTSDPSYADLLKLVEQKAGMLVKHSIKPVTPSPGINETIVEQVAAGTRTTTIWRTPKGDLRCVSLVPPGQPGYIMEHFVKEDDDIEKVMSIPHTRQQYDLNDTHKMLESVGDRGVLYVSYSDPMYCAACLFDYEDFTIRCMTDADRLQAMIEYFAEGIYEEVETMATVSEGLPILFYTAGPELATPPMLPPSVFARFVTPYHKRIIEILHRHGHITCIHCHGRVGQVLDQVIETGADALEPIEPPDQGDITLAKLIEKVDGRLCLIGYIQDQDFYTARPGDMRRKVEEIVEVVSPPSRYIMTPTCTPFQFPPSPAYINAYAEWVEAAAELLP